MCIRLKETWAKVGLGHSPAFPAWAVLGLKPWEALSVTRFLKYTAYCHLCHLDPAIESQGPFLQCHELLTAISCISQTMQHKKPHYYFILSSMRHKKSHCFTPYICLIFFHIFKIAESLRLSCLCGLGKRPNLWARMLMNRLKQTSSHSAEELLEKAWGVSHQFCPLPTATPAPLAGFPPLTVRLSHVCNYIKGSSNCRGSTC